MDDIYSVRSRRKRKARDMADISQCLCGDIVSPVQIGAGIEVAQAKRQGAKQDR